MSCLEGNWQVCMDKWLKDFEWHFHLTTYASASFVFFPLSPLSDFSCFLIRGADISTCLAHKHWRI